MKDLLLRYAAYHIWANDSLLKIVLQLTAKQVDKEVKSSFDTVYKTCLHLYHAEKIWWLRVQQAEAALTQRDLKPTIQELATSLLLQSTQWHSWLQKRSEEELQAFFTYKNMKGETFVQPFWEVQLHLFNHAQFHRGQLVTQLRQLGVGNLPPTDFVHWARLNNA